ncbi:MAG: sigma-54-dependent Fis family transcriptional regulator [Deltaproteobacteria bacterium]|nr:MAG: sigma-54-dependent Fis family transcriptional regulator [Deltaproteobacteria bacterium]
MSRPPHPTKRIVCAPDSPLQRVLRSLPRVAKSPAPALVIGESGTGKEGVVRRIHDLGPWSGGPFVPLNCGAVPASLLESELFGHVRGAFTGADRGRAGRIEAAAHGTFLLDEVGELPLALQPKLLRVLQEREFNPVGSESRKRVEARIVAATNRDLVAEVEAGRFRSDLFFRLDVVRIELPPLRERMMDVPHLAQHFLELHAEPNGSRVTGFTPEALDELGRYGWPGNVRELENIILGILVLREDGLIEREDIRRKLSQRPGAAAAARDGVSIALPADGLSLKDTLERVERDLIREALLRTHGNRSHAATLLGLNRTTLVEKLKRRPVGSDYEEAHA